MEAVTHKCFIQVAKSPAQEKEDKKKKKQKRGAAVGLATLEANGEGMGSMDNEDKPPVHVFFDIEAMQETGRHVPNLLIAETECDDRLIRFRGDHCV